MMPDFYFPRGTSPFPCPLKGGCGRPCSTGERIALEEHVHETEKGSVLYGYCHQFSLPEPFMISREDAEEEFVRQSLTQASKKPVPATTQEIEAIVVKEANRVIAARAPKRKRKYGHEGNGRKGPKTNFMEKQRRILAEWIKSHPEALRGKKTKEPAAKLCWLEHKKDWDRAKTATGENHGYSSTKALAASFA